MSTLILKEYALDSKPRLTDHVPHVSSLTNTAFLSEKQIFFSYGCPNALWVLAINVSLPSALDKCDCPRDWLCPENEEVILQSAAPLSTLGCQP